MNNTESQYEQQEGQVTYASATAIVAEGSQSRPVIGNQVDFYTNPYVYVQDSTNNANLMPAPSLPANFFPTAYFPSTAPAALDFLWTPWPFDMIHGELSSPLVDYHSQQFPGNSSNQLHNRLPPLQPGLVPTEFPLQSFMTRSSNAATYGTRAQTSGRKGGRRPREIEDKEYDLTPEDKDKRAKRRERNKQAAARCRKRRMDLMETLQVQVEKLKQENEQKQMIIEQLNHQQQEMMSMLGAHNCQIQPGMVPQQLRLQQQQAKEQERMYKAQIQQQSIQLKMEHDNGLLDQRLNSEMESLFKDEQMNTDRSSPINDYPITTCSMITNNDPVISHANFQSSSSSKRSKHNQSPMDSNDGPTFLRPSTLPLVSQYSDMSNNLPSFNTPSAGLGCYGDFSVLNQQTFLTPTTLDPIPVVSRHSDTPQHGELRQL